MQYCCLNCFTDLAITELIQREGHPQYCSFCKTDVALCVEPKRLAELFELVLGCLEEDSDGVELFSLYVDEFQVISKDVGDPRSLVHAIMGDSYLKQRYSLKSEITEYREAWNVSKRELIVGNRFFRLTLYMGKFFQGRLMSLVVV